MKKISLGDCIYEFHCDPQLLLESQNNLNSLKSEMSWTETVPGDLVSIKLGYMDKNFTIPYYDDKLFSWLQQCIDSIVQEELPGTSLAICDSWLTRLSFGQASIAPHTHACSVLSGVFYFTSRENTFTTFYRKSYLDKFATAFFSHNNRPGDIKDFERNKFVSVSEAGKLLLFPSDMHHTISLHKEMKNVRYTLALNTFFNKTAPRSILTGHLDLNVKTSKEKFEEWQAKKAIDSNYLTQT